MTEEEILHDLEQGEGPALVFLQARTRARKLGETLVSLANVHGGRVFLGVRGRRHGRVEGLPHPEESVDFVLEVAQQCLPPMDLPEPEIVHVEGSAILVITVPAGLPYVYHYRGRYLQRIDRKALPLSGVELRGMLMERSEEGFERQAVAGACLEDLDMAKVAAFCTYLSDPPDDPIQLLRQRGGVVESPEGPIPTVAGLLFFGRHPQGALPQARIWLVRYPGKSSSPDPQRQEVEGTLPEQIQQVEAFLNAQMRRGRMWMDGERVEVTEYPIEAVREAIVNAVAHRDYSLQGDQIRVQMFQNRIEVYSPGRLPGPITVDNIVEERFSRNPLLVQMLADMGLIEQLGYGIDRMVALMKEAHLPEPDFQEMRAGFLVTLFGPEEMAVEGIPMDPQALARLGLNERQIQALTYLDEHGSITSREYQELCPEVSAETLRRDLLGLIGQGLLLKVGESRATYYILK